MADGRLLHQDLLRALHNNRGCAWISHPLIVVGPYDDSMAPTVNRQYALRAQRAAEALERGDVGGYLDNHDVMFRLEALRLIEEDISAEDYSLSLARVWGEFSRPSAIAPAWLHAFRSRKYVRRYAVGSAIAEWLDTAAGPIEVYRGSGSLAHAMRGIAWTMSRAQATHAAGAVGGSGCVVSGTVVADNILYAGTKQPAETLVIDPACVIGLQATEVL